MIIINLLSPEQKKELKIKRIYLAIKEVVMLILLFTSIIAIMLGVSRYVLEEQLADIIERNISTINAGQQVNNQIIVLNKKINLINDVQKNFKHWSVFFKKISQLTPDEIIYNSLKIYHQEAILELQGTAQTRQDLLKLQKNLEESQLFKKVDLPLNNLIEKENNTFNITAEINLNNIP